MKAIATTLGIARSHLHDRLQRALFTYSNKAHSSSQ